MHRFLNPVGKLHPAQLVVILGCLGLGVWGIHRLRAETLQTIESYEDRAVIAQHAFEADTNELSWRKERVAEHRKTREEYGRRFDSLARAHTPAAEKEANALFSTIWAMDRDGEVENHQKRIGAIETHLVYKRTTLRAIRSSAKHERRHSMVLLAAMLTLIAAGVALTWIWASRRVPPDAFDKGEATSGDDRQ